MKKNIKVYAVSVIAALLTGAVSALLTVGNMNLYDTINLPPLSPPGAVFPIVWTILYILMGISAAIIFESGDARREDALKLYGINLAVNFLWSIIFFNLRAFLFSFIWLVLLWVIIVIMIKEFKKISILAAKLLIPYFIWVTFAGYLNLAIYFLNL